jgi:DNA gyrase inhibitor GyrI
MTPTEQTYRERIRRVQLFVAHDSPHDTPPEELRTDVYVPLEPR